MLLPKKYRQPILVFLLLCLFVITVEMRPGRVYFLLQMLLFQESIANLLLYLAVFGFTAWSLQVALFNHSKIIRFAAVALWLPFLFASLIYRFVTGYNYSYADAHTALNNTQLLPAAFENFAYPIALAFASTLGIVLLLYLVTKRVRYRFRPSAAWALLPAVLLSYWYINRSLGVVDDLPAFYRVPMSSFIAHYHTLPNSPRQPVQAAPQQAGVKHLFLIVDESITGSALSLNGNSASTTPFLERAQKEIHNFGIASAYTNSSAGSNIALMSGLQLEELPDRQMRALTRPNIFQYAKQAGYTTYFVDAQVGRGMLQNFMSLQDLQHIDHFVQVTEEQLNQPYYTRDFVMADLLLRLSKSDEKVFVYANKVGAHWPYARTYPPDSIFFSPVLSERSMLKDREKSTNTYYNSIRWTVDSFWKKLMSGISAQDSTFIVYTSDHGQDLSGDGISITHASSNNTNPIEANVPLWCLDKTGYTASLPLPQPNRQSHAQIFPTLLMLQGYEKAFIRRTFGPTLYDVPPTSTRTFLSGDIFGRGTSTIHPFSN